MTVGLEVYNDSNTIQVTQDYAGFGLRAKGTVTLVTDGAYAAMLRATLTVTATTPIMAFSGSGTRGVFITKTINNGDGTWTYYFAATGATSVTITYYLFDDCRFLNITDTTGLAVYKSDGTMAFHSGMKVLRVVQLLNQTPPASGSTTKIIKTDVAVPAGKVYAVVQGTFAYRETQTISRDQDQVGSGKVRVTIAEAGSAASNDGTTVTAGLFQYDSYSTVITGNNNSTYDIVTGNLIHWIIDVTNY